MPPLQANLLISFAAHPTAALSRAHLSPERAVRSGEQGRETRSHVQPRETWYCVLLGPRPHSAACCLLRVLGFSLWDMHAQPVRRVSRLFNRPHNCVSTHWEHRRANRRASTLPAQPGRCQTQQDLPGCSDVGRGPSVWHFLFYCETKSPNARAEKAVNA